MINMKKMFSILIVITLTIITSQSQAKEVYSVGVVPQFEARKLHSIWRPILNYLEQETAYKFELSGATTIPKFEKEFSDGSFDFAYMNPYHLVIANEKAGYIPLLRDHGRQLYGVLVVKNDGKINSVKDLNGKTLVFPAPNALGASLQMRQELSDNFGIKIKPNYVKTHDSVYLDVLLGKASAGGGVQKTLNRQKKQYREALKVIHTTKKVTPHPLAVLPSVPDKVREAVKAALLKYDQTAEGKKQLQKIPMKQIGSANIADYLPLKELGLERFYVSPNH
jgi:phosphonate transport system substrate-binding protein